jgi:hypothetical protein
VDAERGELRFFLPVSIGLHLVLFLIVHFDGIGRPDAMLGRGAGLGRGSTEVVFVNRPLNPIASAPSQPPAEPAHAAPGHPRLASRLRGSSSPRSSSGKASSGMSSTSESGVPAATGEGHSPSFCMRDCLPLASPAEPGPSSTGGEDEGRPAILRQREGQGMKMVRYADGGRLFSSTSGPIEGGPHLGLLGLMDLADGQVGGRPGHDACNLYRVPARGARTLVLLVDTSASVGDESTACAAGAALAALDHGFAVEVVNFSSRMMHQSPTHDADAIYETLSTIQRRGTILPEVGQLASSSARPRDLVAITDTAAGNYEGALEGYQKALRSHPDNRGILYLLGRGEVCKRCAGVSDDRERCTDCRETTRAPLEAFAKAGFVVENADPDPP